MVALGGGFWWLLGVAFGGSWGWLLVSSQLATTPPLPALLAPGMELPPRFRPPLHRVRPRRCCSNPELLWEGENSEKSLQKAGREGSGPGRQGSCGLEMQGVFKGKKRLHYSPIKVSPSLPSLCQSLLRSLTSPSLSEDRSFP